jgi:hypothetical protein
MLFVPALYGQLSNLYIAYCCPLCLKTHRHSSAGDLFNRVGSRWSHCWVKKSDVDMVISSLTPRVRPPVHQNAPPKNPSDFVVLILLLFSFFIRDGADSIC